MNTNPHHIILEYILDPLSSLHNSHSEHSLPTCYSQIQKCVKTRSVQITPVHNKFKNNPECVCV